MRNAPQAYAPTANSLRPKVRLQAPEEQARQAPRSIGLPPPEQFGIAPPQAPTVRLQSPEEAALAFPSPEQLGIAPPSGAAAFDWNSAKQRIDRLSAQGFHCDRLPRAGFRVTLLVPDSTGMHHIEAEAPTEAEAVLAALQRAETIRR